MIWLQWVLNPKVYYLQWSAVNPRATVVIAHGMVEHPARYDELAKFLADGGIAVYGIYHIGHGRIGHNQHTGSIGIIQKGLGRRAQRIDGVKFHRTNEVNKISHILFVVFLPIERYNIGTTILIYNKNMVKEKPDSWKVLWDEQYKGKVLMFNNPRDSFAIAQFILGQSINTTEKADW